MSDPADFEAWGWRIPFLISILLLAVSLWIRLKLSESPVFKAMKEAGTTSKNPFVDSIKYPGNIKRIFVAMFGVAAGLTVIYYNSQFYTLYFLTGTARDSGNRCLALYGDGRGDCGTVLRRCRLAIRQGWSQEDIADWLCPDNCRHVPAVLDDGRCGEPALAKATAAISCDARFARMRL